MESEVWGWDEGSTPKLTFSLSLKVELKIFKSPHWQTWRQRSRHLTKCGWTPVIFACCYKYSIHKAPCHLSGWGQGYLHCPSFCWNCFTMSTSFTLDLILAKLSLTLLRTGSDVLPVLMKVIWVRKSNRLSWSFHMAQVNTVFIHAFGAGTRRRHIG